MRDPEPGWGGGRLRPGGGGGGDTVAMETHVCGLATFLSPRPPTERAHTLNCPSVRPRPKWPPSSDSPAGISAKITHFGSRLASPHPSYSSLPLPPAVWSAGRRIPLALEQLDIRPLRCDHLDRFSASQWRGIAGVCAAASSRDLAPRRCCHLRTWVIPQRDFF